MWIEQELKKLQPATPTLDKFSQVLRDIREADEEEERHERRMLERQDAVWEARAEYAREARGEE